MRMTNEEILRGATKISDEAIAKYGWPAEVVTCQDTITGKCMGKDGRFQDEPVYWHWKSIQHLTELAKRQGVDFPEYQPYYYSEKREVSPAGTDAMNWIDDAEYRF